MSRCVVNGCKSRRRNSNSPHISMHGFPKSTNGIKLWLQQTGQDFGDIDAFAERIKKKSSYYRMCSAHFSEDSYYMRGIQKVLRPDAIPTIFNNRVTRFEINDIPSTSAAQVPEIQPSFLPFNVVKIENDGTYCPPQFGVSEPCFINPCPTLAAPSTPSINHIGTNTSEVDTHHQGTTLGPTFGLRSMKTQTSYLMNKRNASTSTVDLVLKKDASMWTGVTPTLVDSSTSTDDLLEVSKELQYSSSTDNQSKSHACTSTERTKLMPVSKIPVHEENSKSNSEGNSVVQKVIQNEQFSVKDLSSSTKINGSLLKQLSLMNYPKYCSETANPFTNLSPMNVPTKEELVNERKFIVFESCLDTLFSKLECSYDDQCKAHISTFQKNVVGTLLIVYGECGNGHRSKLWQSQPMIGQIGCGDLLSSAAMLFSGNHFSKISEMLHFLRVSFLSDNFFSICQKKILFPVIDLHWKRDRQTTIGSLKDKPLSLSGDGLRDNPEICIYTLLEDTTKKIIDFSAAQVSRTNSSVTTESKAFRRCLNNVISEGLLVHIIATDLQVGIRKIMSKEYSDISHQFDVWNYSESIRKKMTSVTKKKTCKSLKPWIASILNHLWASSSGCHGNVEMMRESWKSVLYHISNTHVWDDGILINGCKHGELSKEECEERPWIPKNTMAYSVLEKLIGSGQIQKDMQHLAEYCHTAEIEMFHTMVLKYLPKNVKFKMDAIQARTKLAILAHNTNVNKPPVRIALVSESARQTGSLRRKPFLPKSRKRCRVEPVYECTFEFVSPMMSDVLKMASADVSQILPTSRQSSATLEKHISHFKRLCV
ncbi:uncharacterized protein O3C94_021388 [Discoglossus pictus]